MLTGDEICLFCLRAHGVGVTMGGAGSLWNILWTHDILCEDSKDFRVYFAVASCVVWWLYWAEIHQQNSLRRFKNIWNFFIIRLMFILNFENEGFTNNAVTHKCLFKTLSLWLALKFCADDLLTQFEVSIKTKRPVVLNPFPAVECVKKVTAWRAAGGRWKMLWKFNDSTCSHHHLSTTSQRHFQQEKMKAAASRELRNYFSRGG